MRRLIISSGQATLQCLYGLPKPALGFYVIVAGEEIRCVIDDN